MKTHTKLTFFLVVPNYKEMLSNQISIVACKPLLLLLLVLVMAAFLSAASWNTFTNTNHVYDLKLAANSIIYGSWGGAVKLSDPALIWPPVQQQIWITKDGISSNEIRSIEYIPSSTSVWFGSYNSGISIVSPSGIQVIDYTNGLPSANNIPAKIRKIIAHESRIFVATDLGLSEFSYIEGINFPLLLHQYNSQNTAGGLVNNDIEDMAIGSNGYLYLATPVGISFIHADSLDINAAWKTWNSSSTPIMAGSPIRLSVNNDMIAISVFNTVYQNYQYPMSQNWSTYYPSSPLCNAEISALGLDDDNGVYIAYGSWNEDLLRYSRSTDTLFTYVKSSDNYWHQPESSNGLGTATISKIVDSGDGIYLCSWGDGIYRQSGDNWKSYYANCIGFPKITDIAIDQNHAIWTSSGYISATPTRKGSLGISRLSGSSWTSYNMANSPIHTDNVISVAVDQQNRKWFGTWAINTNNNPLGWKNGLSVLDDSSDIWKYFNHEGIRIFDDELNTWGPIIPGSARLLGNTIGDICADQAGNVLVACYDHGLVVFDENDNLIQSFEVANSNNQRVLYIYHSGDKYFFGTYNDRGLVIWNHNSLPETNGAHWLIPPPPQLSNCEVYGIITVNTPYEGKQHWIAASTGLFMWNEVDWYRYDTAIKRLKYTNGNWQNETLYYVDEERLFGSVPTIPSAILLDPFNRIWIGSVGNGFSVYDPQTERFVNYFPANSPLLSPYVTSLSYDPLNGLLLIGSPEGLVTLEIGRTIITTEKLENVIAYPNPFYPARADHRFVRISNYPENSMPAGKNQCRIYDSSGALVIILEQNVFARFHWNGKNKEGNDCGTGIYFFVVSDEKGNSQRGKIALIR